MIAGSSSVFAYTFATPNNTRNPNTNRTNIFNFCFTDDFVPQVPLTEWGYGKHGTLYTACAEDLYKTSPAFQKDVDRFVSDSNEKDQATFNAGGTASLVSYVQTKWGTLQQYYEQVSASSIDSDETLYTFLRGMVAPAAMKKFIGQLSIFVESRGLVDTAYVPIAQYFVSGSGALGYDSYIFDTHGAFTYYTAVKYNLFNKS